MEWYREWHISKSFFGYWFQHPGYDPEKASDWRYGYAATVRDARDEIDRLLVEDSEWSEAALIISSDINRHRQPLAPTP